MIEGVLRESFAAGGVELEMPFPRMPYAEAMRRFGTDRPDLRYGDRDPGLERPGRGVGLRGLRGGASRPAGSCAASSCPAPARASAARSATS